MLANFKCTRTCIQAGDVYCRFRPVLDSLGPVRVNSHTVTVTVEYRDQEALRLAVLSLGGIWYGRGHYDLYDTKQDGYGFRLPMKGGRHRVGEQTYWYHPIVLREDGQLAYDAFGGTWGDLSGLGKLKDAYAVVVVEQAAHEQGWLTERQGLNLVVYHPSGGVLTVSPGLTIDTTGFTGMDCHTAREQLGLDRLGLAVDTLEVKPEMSQVAAEVQMPSR